MKLLVYILIISSVCLCFSQDDRPVEARLRLPRSLSTAVNEFNYINRSEIKESKQNLLDESEVLISLATVTAFFGGESLQKNKLASEVQKITQTKKLPANCDIKLLTGIVNSDGKYVARCFCIYLEFDVNKQTEPGGFMRSRVLIRHQAIY